MRERGLERERHTHTHSVRTETERTRERETERERPRDRERERERERETSFTRKVSLLVEIHHRATRVSLSSLVSHDLGPGRFRPVARKLGINERAGEAVWKNKIQPTASAGYLRGRKRTQP